jgi:hypothetical protein
VRIRSEGRFLEVVHTPVLHWAFCLLFIGVGGVFLAGPFGLFTDAARLQWWLRILITALGGVGVGVGVWQLLTVPRSTLLIDRTAGRARMHRVGIAGKSSREVSIASIAAVELLEHKDDEGNPVYQLRLFIRDGEPVVLSPVWPHGRERLEAIARALAEATGVETVNVRPLTSGKIRSA